ncbi:MAG: response regulator, partial [Gammaproteobacteria bacterium]|nr:response regulator [Gammaproteobacteria bacterium]
LGRWIRENTGGGAGALPKQDNSSDAEVIEQKQEIEQILIIDDDEDYRNLTVRRLSRSFPNVSIKEIDPVNNEMPDKHFCWDNIDLIILDYDFGLDYTGLDWVKIFNTKELPATILMTAQGNEEVATKAIKIGIDDYIVKEHFHEKELMELIKKCVLNKKNRKTIISDIKNKSIVFNKSNFIQKLQLITNEKDTTNNLLLISPEAYQQIGAKKGIRHQDSYMRYVTDWIYAYMTLNNITSNIFVYREEYIAVIIETYRCEKHVKAICEQLNTEKYAIGTEKYPCSINMGVISPQHFEENEFNRTDYELLSIALILCNAAKSDEENQVCNYGDIDVEDAEIIDGDHDIAKISIDFDIKRAVAD